MLTHILYIPVSLLRLWTSLSQVGSLDPYDQVAQELSEGSLEVDNDLGILGPGRSNNASDSFESHLRCRGQWRLPLNA